MPPASHGDGERGAGHSGHVLGSTNKVLTIAADATGSTGTVRIAGVDNDVDAPDKTVTVKGAAVNGLGAADPADVELTLEDDDTRGVTVSTSMTRSRRATRRPTRWC